MARLAPRGRNATRRDAAATPGEGTAVPEAGSKAKADARRGGDRALEAISLGKGEGKHDEDHDRDSATEAGAKDGMTAAPCRRPQSRRVGSRRRRAGVAATSARPSKRESNRPQGPPSQREVEAGALDDDEQYFSLGRGSSSFHGSMGSRLRSLQKVAQAGGRRRGSGADLAFVHTGEG
jgi:hypothetical protein